MTTLSKRATPRQAMVLRMIEGACRNAAHAHPGQILDDRLARSIAKRAAGTLTSAWGAVLAAPPVRSEGGSVEPANGPLPGTGRTISGSGGSVAKNLRSRPGARQRSQWRAPLQLLRAAIESAVEEAVLRGELGRWMVAGRRSSGGNRNCGQQMAATAKHTRGCVLPPPPQIIGFG